MQPTTQRVTTPTPSISKPLSPVPQPCTPPVTPPTQTAPQQAPSPFAPLNLSQNRMQQPSIHLLPPECAVPNTLNVTPPHASCAKAVLPRLPLDFGLSEADVFIANTLCEQQTHASNSAFDCLANNNYAPAVDSHALNAVSDRGGTANLFQYPLNGHTSAYGPELQMAMCDQLFAQVPSQITHDHERFPWSAAPRAANKWTCNTCSYQFAYKDHLARHRAFVHEGKTESKCSHCSKVYVEFKSLRRHINQNHINVSATETSFFCYWCSFRCSQLEQWKNHILTAHYPESYAHRINWDAWSAMVRADNAKGAK